MNHYRSRQRPANDSIWRTCGLLFTHTLPYLFPRFNSRIFLEAWNSCLLKSSCSPTAIANRYHYPVGFCNCLDLPLYPRRWKSQFSCKTELEDMYSYMRLTRCKPRPLWCRSYPDDNGSKKIARQSSIASIPCSQSSIIIIIARNIYFTAITGALASCEAGP